MRSLDWHSPPANCSIAANLPHYGADLVPETSTTTPRGLVTRPPEVVAPAGGWPQLHATIGNGANAIYIGLSAFSARTRAANFHPHTELPKAVQTCHAAGVKVYYVSLNALVFDHELQEVKALIRQCAIANVDALIVQDLGVARLAQQIAPQFRSPCVDATNHYIGRRRRLLRRIAGKYPCRLGTGIVCRRN
jgi:hypothetical protein